MRRRESVTPFQRFSENFDIRLCHHMTTDANSKLCKVDLDNHPRSDRIAARVWYDWEEVEDWDMEGSAKPYP
jgi:hypothetical protein